MTTGVSTSKGAAHLYRSRHTTVAKGDCDTNVDKVGELMKVDSETSLQQLYRDKMVQEDVHTPRVLKSTQLCINNDRIIEASLRHSITIFGVLLKSMEAYQPASNELSHLFSIMGNVLPTILGKT